MWLGHSIEHLMCIGGELEHHKALSPSARKNRALCSALARGGIYRHLIGPGWSHEPGLKGSLWSRFKPRTGPMVVGQERGPLVLVHPTNRDQKIQMNRDQWPTWPGWPPGLTNRDQCPHWSRFWTEPGLMG